MSAVVTPPARESFKAACSYLNGSALRQGPLVAAGVLGAMAWSGWPLALALASFAPVLILTASTRRDAGLRAAAYFAGATWPIVPAAAVFFGADAGALRVAMMAIAFWLAVSALNAVPWMAGSPERAGGRVAGVLLGLALAAAPPLALIGLASPLAGLGWWWPGTGAWGVGAYAVLLSAFVAIPRPSVRRSIGALAAIAVVLANAWPGTPSLERASWAAVPTRQGSAVRGVEGWSRDSGAVERLRRAVAASKDRVLVLPESVFEHWNGSQDAFLRPLWRELAARDRIVLFGVRRAEAATSHVENLVLIRGSEQGEYAQHLPVPVSLYRFGARGSVPLRWRGSYIAKAAGERVGLLICWEQLLVAPMLIIAGEKPDRLVGLSNLYFAKGTPVASIQRASIQSWARLFGIPWVHAVNE